jgi:hypothetical protein
VAKAAFNSKKTFFTSRLDLTVSSTDKIAARNKQSTGQPCPSDVTSTNKSQMRYTGIETGPQRCRYVQSNIPFLQ